MRKMDRELERHTSTPVDLFVQTEARHDCSTVDNNSQQINDGRVLFSSYDWPSASAITVHKMVFRDAFHTLAAFTSIKHFIDKYLHLKNCFRHAGNV